ncbi:MAG: HAMP domain-containing sensor histidine kinase [Anaerovoracaceae bacterium]
MSYLWLIVVAVAALLVIGFIIIYYRKRENAIVDRLEKMLSEAKDHNFCSETIDETKVSSLENSMSKFLTDNMVSSKNSQEQKETIQTLISDISHQTVTPISNILIYSQLIEEQIKDEGIKKEVVAIREQTEKLSFLIESLVKTSRLETGIIAVVPRLSSVGELIENIANQGKVNALQKEITIDVEKTHIMAMFDPKWTTEGLFNILDNSIKYTKQGGKIKIFVEEYTMFCKISIEDNGVGISEDDIPKIFGRFYRVKSTSQEKGVGLGLYLTREIIKKQGGFIKVLSEKEKGTTFQIFLPY